MREALCRRQLLFKIGEARFAPMMLGRHTLQAEGAGRFCSREISAQFRFRHRAMANTFRFDHSAMAVSTALPAAGMSATPEDTAFRSSEFLGQRIFGFRTEHCFQQAEVRYAGKLLAGAAPILIFTSRECRRQPVLVSAERPQKPRSRRAFAPCAHWSRRHAQSRCASDSRAPMIDEYSAAEFYLSRHRMMSPSARGHSRHRIGRKFARVSYCCDGR